jgi:hypothetical protein
MTDDNDVRVAVYRNDAVQKSLAIVEPNEIGRGDDVIEAAQKGLTTVDLSQANLNRMAGLTQSDIVNRFVKPLNDADEKIMRYTFGSLSMFALSGLAWSLAPSANAIPAAFAIGAVGGICLYLVNWNAGKYNTLKEKTLDLAKSGKASMQRCLDLCMISGRAESYRQKVIQSGRPLLRIDLDVMQALMEKESELVMLEKLSSSAALIEDAAQMEDRREKR